MLEDYLGCPRVVFSSHSTELLRVSLPSVGVDERKKKELRRHAESQLNYLEEPHGVQRRPAHGCRSSVFVCVFFFLFF